jgi:hypothetical protein
VEAAQRAVGINDSVGLSPIRVGLHDELFQGSQPVLTGIDAASTYCYLLAALDWNVRCGHGSLAGQHDCSK